MENNNFGNDEISLKEIVIKLRSFLTLIKSKWKLIVLFGFIGGGVGLVYAHKQSPVYIAKLNFALEDDKGSSGSIMGAMNLVSTLGIDLGTSAGGAFSGANLIELMKSRTIVEKALLNPISTVGASKSLASKWIELKKMNSNWSKYPQMKNVDFPVGVNRSLFNFHQDSILGILYKQITAPNTILSVSQKDKKVSILSVEVKSEDEIFSKRFAESIVKEVSEFYIQTKSKKARTNVEILQKQADSIRAELNRAITGVASSNDNTFNFNPAQNVMRTPSAKKQIDVQANTAILTQLVVNLEMAKVTLLKETPLIQIIDRPILPLQIEKVSKRNSLIVGGILGGIFAVMFLLVIKMYATIKSW